MVLRILNKTKDVTKHLHHILVKLFKYALCMIGKLSRRIKRNKNYVNRVYND